MTYIGEMKMNEADKMTNSMCMRDRLLDPWILADEIKIKKNS